MTGAGETIYYLNGDNTAFGVTWIVVRQHWLEEFARKVARSGEETR